MQNRQHTDKGNVKFVSTKKPRNTTSPSAVELEVCWLYHLRKRSCISLQIDDWKLYLMHHSDAKKQIICQTT